MKILHFLLSLLILSTAITQKAFAKPARFTPSEKNSEALIHLDKGQKVMMSYHIVRFINDVDLLKTMVREMIGNEDEYVLDDISNLLDIVASTISLSEKQVALNNFSDALGLDYFDLSDIPGEIERYLWLIRFAVNSITNSVNRVSRVKK